MTAPARIAAAGSAERPAGTGPDSRWSWASHAVLALLAFVPLLLTGRGRVTSDTRQYFLVDPWKFLSRAGSLWDPNVHLGTVTHSNVGNLFPMGAFFAFTDRLGLPMWSAQRLWIGFVLFTAGTGVLAFGRAISWRGTGPLVAAVVYMLTPYTLQYASRTSVLLLPFAALPWTIACTDRALRTGGWRYPALLALIAMTASGANPATFLMVVPGAVLWVAFALGRKEVAWRDVGLVVARTGVLTVGTCAAWIMALVLEGRYGLNLLLYTETLPQVSVASTSFEMLRGLGYWLFYGTEARDPNVAAAVDYLERTPIILLSYAVPLLAVVAAFTTQWRHRAFAISLVLTGVILGVGAYPYDDSSPFGRAYRAAAENSVGLALRSSARAVPLAVLGVALLLGAGAHAIAARGRRIAVVTLVGLGVLAVANLPALFTGGFVDVNFSRPEAVPDYWREAAVTLDGGRPTRVLELPGSQFAAYRWGMTYDTPILPTLLDERASVAREQTPYGSAAAVDLLSALDRRLQEGTLDPESIAPVARLLGVGDILVRSDLEFERYATARPRNVWQLLGGPVAGLGAPVPFGPAAPNEPDPRLPLDDPVTLGVPSSASDPPALAIRPVERAEPIIRSAPAEAPVVIAGDGDGVVDAAAAGLLTGDELVLSAPWLARHPRTLARAVRDDAELVITDTNRRRDRRWRSLRYTTGLTDRPGHDQPRTGQGEATLDAFPHQTDADRTVMLPEGGVVDATRYGGLVTFDPDQRAAAAFDGDPTTAWQVDDLTDPVGQSLTVRLPEPVTTDHIELLQSQNPVGTRSVSDLALHFSDGTTVGASLGTRSRRGSGQRVDFPSRTFDTISIRIRSVVTAPEAATLGTSRTGFAEIRIPGIEVHEVIRLPTRLTRAVRSRSLGHRLAYVLSRQRSNPADTEADRQDEELALVRQFDVPDTRSFALSGTARLSGRASEGVLDTLLGQQAGSAVAVRSSDHLAGAIDQRAHAALDGDPATFWSGDLLAPTPSRLDVALPGTRTVDHLDLVIVADGHHSVPTQIRLTAKDGASRTVDLPPVPDGTTRGATAAVPVDFAALTTDAFGVELTGLRPVDTIATATGVAVPLPPAVAELGIPGVTTPDAAAVDSGCRDDLLLVDGTPVAIRITGPADDAVRRRRLAVTACGGPLSLAAGTHRLTAARGATTGFDLDRLVLTSDAGGGAATLGGDGRPVPTVRPSAPPIAVTDSGATSADVRVPAGARGFWLVLGQSYSDGWDAAIEGRSLGAPVLVDGFGNGWWVPAQTDSGTIELRWTPQRTLWTALALSIVTTIGCLVLVVRGRRASARPPDADPVLRLPIGPDEAARGWGVTALAAAAVGLVGYVLVGPIAAVIGLVVGGVAAAWRYGRIVLAVTAILLLGAACGQVARVQRQEARPVRYDWARGFETEHRLALTGLVLLAADPAVVARRRRRGGAPETADAVDG